MGFFCKAVTDLLSSHPQATKEPPKAKAKAKPKAAPAAPEQPPPEGWAVWFFSWVLSR